MTRDLYLVRCARCDRAFWQGEPDGPVPAHDRWERGTTAPDDVAGTGGHDRCEGGGRPGYWIGVGEGTVADPMDLRSEEE